MKKVNKFLVLFLFGFMAYITIEVCYRGYSYPLMGVCGGIAIVLLDQINNKISWDVDILLQGVIGSLIITFFEFVIGNLFLKGYLPVMWNYSNLWMNYVYVYLLPELGVNIPSAIENPNDMHCLCIVIRNIKYQIIVYRHDMQLSGTPRLRSLDSPGQ